MILNQNKFPKIVRDGLGNNQVIEYKSHTHMFDVRDWDDHDYWYCEIMIEHAFTQYPITDLVPEDILKKIKEDDNTFLAVSNYLEAFQGVVDHIYTNLVLENNIPPKKILFISNGNDIYLRVKQIANNLNLDYLNVEWDAGWASFLRKNKNKQDKIMLETLNPKKTYPRRFLSLNRRWRPHRCSLVALLAVRRLLDKGHISFAPSDDQQTWKDVLPWIIELNQTQPEVLEDLNTFKEVFYFLPALYVDKSNLVEDNVTNIINNTNYFYENTLFSVVTETNFYRSEGFETVLTLTEKTFKPIISLHPFILVSIPGSLAALKELGYKTFHPWINESYDK